MKTWDVMLADARVTTSHYEDVERKAGFATPQEAGRRETLRVVLSALAAGHALFQRGEIDQAWECVAEAAVQIEKIMQQPNATRGGST